MDFSTILSSVSLLYIALGVTALLIIVLAYKFFFGKNEVVSAVPRAGMPTTTGVSVASETQAVTHPVETLPSTDVINQTPATEQEVTLPAAEAVKAEVPPLSSWKPSPEAASIPVKDDVVSVSNAVNESAEEKPAQ